MTTLSDAAMQYVVACGVFNDAESNLRSVDIRTMSDSDLKAAALALRDALAAVENTRSALIQAAEAA